MSEISKLMNKTNTSYRELGSGDAKNTDLFFDKEHRDFFGDNPTVTVRLEKKNIAQAFLFIASMLPKKFDSSSVHENRYYSAEFVEIGLKKIDAVFGDNPYRDFVWAVRKDVPMKNGKLDDRLYLNDLLSEHEYTDKDGKIVKFKFTIRDYLLGGYSTLVLSKEDGSDIIKLKIVNSSTPTFVDERPSSQLVASGLVPGGTQQKIYYGCPGTGKSYKVKNLTEGPNGENIVYFDANGSVIDDIATASDKSKITSNIFRTTFHPDYDYSTFVGSYKPVMKPVLDDQGNETDNEELVYEFVPQVFTNAYVRAWKSLEDPILTTDEKQVYLIIEEINRGNCAQIFGDLFQLLDRKNGRSEFSIIPDAELSKYLAKQGLVSNKLVLPENLHILATMNTSDQSLFPMDSAFKRRWAMEYVPINLEQKIAKDFRFTIDGKEYLWVDFLRKINQLIRKATDSEDKQMGEFFIKDHVSEEDFKNKVMFYIWNDVCKDLYSASRISPLYFMRSAAGDDKKDVFTFAELFGDGRHNEEDGSDSKPVELLVGFITKYLELKSITGGKTE